MANPFAPERAPRQIELSRRVVVMAVMALTFVAGTLFSTAAFAAGEKNPDVLAMVFALGAFGTLFLILVWYLGQLARVDCARRARILESSRVDRRNPAPGAPWTQTRRPPSGSTIMWAASMFRRSTDAPSIR